MDIVWQGLRFAVRMMARKPALTLQVALTLGLGIGLNVCIFSVFDQLALKPPAARDLDRLAVVREADPANPSFGQAVAPATFLEWKAEARCFEGLAAYESQEARVGPEGSAEFVRTGLVTPGFFQVLGVRPVLGRMFTPDEEAGRAQPIMLSHAYWQSRFQGDPAVLGRTLRLDDQDHYVAGVMPSGTGMPEAPELWRPRVFSAREANGTDLRKLILLGRIREGLSLTQVREEMNALAKRRGERGTIAQVTGGRRAVIEESVFVILSLLLGAVGFVLVIACANVCVLQLARGLSRQGEVALRASLGASRWSIVRQFLTEGLLLSLLGAAIGVLLAAWGLDLIWSNMPAGVSRTMAGWNELSINGRALGFALILSLLSATLSTLLPALRMSKSDLSRVLRESAGASSSGRHRHRTRNILVAAQVALTLMLLVGATLMVDGFISRSSASEILEPKKLLAVKLDLRPLAYDETRLSAVLGETLGRIEALPQVKSAALVSSVPFQRHGGASHEGIQADGQTAAASGSEQYTMVQGVSEKYFRTMGLRLMAGRGFNAQDRMGATPVAILSATTARMLLSSPGETSNPVGRLIRLGRPGAPGPWITVVGVVADLRYLPFGHGTPYVCYRPVAQQPKPVTAIAVRTWSDSSEATRLVSSEIAGMKLGRFPLQTLTMNQVVVESTVGLAYIATLLAVFAVISLAFSTVGIYGVMVWMVQERTREIGLRVALGAREWEVVRMVLGNGAVVALTGVAAGILGGLALSKTLSGFFFGAGTANTEMVVGLGALLTAVSAIACWIPARRAARIDPLAALRTQ